MSEPTPVTEDANATTTELQQRAAADYAATLAAARAKQDQGSTGAREGILPGGAH
ncbi:hypothetical protein [Streptomyces sp. M92]|uniref:hypothetical protein n=1 Tax=Streptomyces sp. M92 TaxID=2944250 RepID=UPI00234A2E21|nr:hypothetical protein [Streptomyces sp. M92]WCN06043.1 hypothetical protein M6G08_30370 [Streptomyces sp. M92]